MSHNGSYTTIERKHMVLVDHLNTRNRPLYPVFACSANWNIQKNKNWHPQVGVERQIFAFFWPKSSYSSYEWIKSWHQLKVFAWNAKRMVQSKTGRKSKCQTVEHDSQACVHKLAAVEKFRKSFRSENLDTPMWINTRLWWSNYLGLVV